MIDWMMLGVKDDSRCCAQVQGPLGLVLYGSEADFCSAQWDWQINVGFVL